MATEQLQDIDRRRYYWERNAGMWFFALLLCVLSIALLYEFGIRRSYDRLQSTTYVQTESELKLQVQILESRLEKYRLLPVLLGRQPPLDEEKNFTSDSTLVWLQQIRYLTGAEEVAIVTSDGQVLMSAYPIIPLESWPTLHDLLTPPKEGRLGREYLALSDDTQLYGFASKLKGNNDAILVVWVDLSLVYQSWALSEAAVIAFDENNIVTLASQSEWIGKSRDELNILTHPKDYAHATTLLNQLGWQVDALEQINDKSLVRQSILLSVLIFVAIVVTFALLIRRRELQIKKVMRDKIYAQELEKQIEKRTKELKAANEHLVEEVNERLRAEDQLKTTQQELIHSAKLATIGQMSTTLSHEYNQPLATMRTYAENAEKLLELDKIDSVKDNLKRIIQQTDRLGHLSKVLMGFARKPTDTISEVNLHACVEEAIMLVQPRNKKQAIEISHNIPQNIRIQGNATSLSQVLLNLLTNAIDAIQNEHTPTGDRIEISFKQSPDLFEITIDDSGPGIPRTQRESIFEPFMTSKSSQQGLGLGLSVVKDIILAYSGSIRANESHLGGARFNIQFPQTNTQARETQ
jgi:two-component system C4-dicarboxylate transport sensor histidine kinase DctB